MNTPITKRVHMNAFKKQSIAKQTKEPKVIKKKVADSAGNLLQGEATVNFGELGKSLGANLEKAKGGEQFKGPDADYFKTLSKKGATGEELAKKGYIHKSKIADYNKAHPMSTPTTPDTAEFKYDPKLTKEKKGSTVDTSTFWSTVDSDKKTRRLTNRLTTSERKMKKYGGSFSDDGTWIAPGEGASEKDKEKYTKYKRRYDIQKQEYDRAKAQAEGGYDSTRTARFQYGTQMTKKVEGGQNIKAPDGTTKKSVFESDVRKGLNLGTVNTGNTNLSDVESMGNIVNNTIKDRLPVTKNFSTSASNASRTVTFKKKGMKMGGFGSKTYKK